MNPVRDLKDHIRSIPDFPKKGILFRDITTLLGNGQAFQAAVNQLKKKYEPMGIQKIIGVESRGFILAAPLAYALGAGLIPVRKKGKLPFHTASVTYDLEYGQDTLQIHTDAVRPGEKTLVIDDLLATGGTAKATCQLVEQLRGTVAGLGFLIELTALEGRSVLGNYDIFSLIQL
jgi:adenine phosphoribosyltransferase